MTSAAEEHDAAALEEYEGPDAGMAAERTDLAWSRSGLSLGVCGLIVLKGLPSVTGDDARPEIGALLLVLGGMTWALGYWSAHHRRPVAGQPRPVAQWIDLAPAALGTAMVGAVGLLVALLSTR